MLRGVFGPRYRKTEMVVPQALDYFAQEEEERLVDRRQLSRLALERAEEHGIIFIDELDKGSRVPHDSPGPDVSREGVQRDLLPLLDGSTVSTRYGSLRTDHILYIGAGAFQENRPSDLIPELQGRFPIRVELDPLTVEDFRKDPDRAGIGAPQTVRGAASPPKASRSRSRRMESRRLPMLRLRSTMRAEDHRSEEDSIRFWKRSSRNSSSMPPDLEDKNWTIDRDYVKRTLEGIVEDEDLSRFIL